MTLIIKRTVLLLLTIFSIINTTGIFSMDLNNNNNNRESVNSESPELPVEIWELIALKLLNLENIRSEQNLENLKSEIKDIFKSFAPLSKMHKSIIANMPQQKDYFQRKKEIIKETLRKTIPNFDWNNIDAKNNNGFTALMVAANHGNKDLVEFLIQNKADINAKDKNGRTAVIWASFGRQKEIIELLAKKGADTSKLIQIL